MVDYISGPSELVKALPTDTLIVIGTAKGYIEHLSWVCEEVIPALRPILSSQHVDSNGDEENDSPTPKRARLNDPRLDLIRSIVSAMQPSPDTAVSTEHWFVGGMGAGAADFTKPLKIVLGALPASVSRHNSPGQPHSVTNLLKKHYRPKESTVVVTLCEKEDHVLSVACAIARVGGVSYQRKFGGNYGLVLDDNQESGQRGTSMMIPPVKVLFPFPLPQAHLNHYSFIADGIRLTRRLVDAPCNDLHTEAFVEEALASVKGLGGDVSTRVIKGKELESKGFGGIYGVGQAAIHPPAMVILMYNPDSSNGAKPVVMVGKGIVYDTGGLSMKTPTSMLGMKRDMGGAAAILAAFVSAVKSGIQRPLHAILCIAENAIGPTSTRPDDVHTLYSGKTVEINNTDAEGRLVLADGVASAIQHFGPEIVIDMATLTGAQGIATGKYFGAIYCNNESLEQAAIEAGRSSGDLVHPMPYAPEFFRQEFKSAVADMKNSVADRSNAQVSCAAQFIGNHMGDFQNTGKWLHVDMASPSYDKKDERATGYGVALLVTLLMQLERQ